MVATLLSLSACVSSHKPNQQKGSHNHEIDLRAFALTSNRDSINLCFFDSSTDSLLIDRFHSMELSRSDSRVPRRIVYNNAINVIQAANMPNQTNKTMVFKLAIDRKGEILAVHYLPESTALIRNKDLPAIFKEIMTYRFESNLNAPCVETGLMKIVLQNISKIQRTGF